MAVLAVSYASSLRAYLEQGDHLAGLRVDIAASRVNIVALEREKARWDDPVYVRTQARLRFGWVLPGEVGFQVLQTDGTALEGGASLSDPRPPLEGDEPVWWQTAWDSVEAAGHPERLVERAPAEQIAPPRRTGG